MMNKMKSAGVHLFKFLFILPLVAVLLLAFRNGYNNREQSPKIEQPDQSIPLPGSFTDTVPAVTTLNNKGYLIDIVGIKSDCQVIVKDKNGKELDRVLLTKWKENQQHYEKLYGEILPPPPPPPPAAPLAPAPPEPVKLPDSIKRINRQNEQVDVGLKNGTKEHYDLSIPSQKDAFTKKYGELPVPPVPPLPPVSAVSPVDQADVTTPVALASPSRINLSGVSQDYEITDQSATLKLKKRGVEKYD